MKKSIFTTAIECSICGHYLGKWMGRLSNYTRLLVCSFARLLNAQNDIDEGGDIRNIDLSVAVNIGAG